MPNPVTAPESITDKTSDSRNAEAKDLATIERELHAMTGGPPSAEQRERWERERLAEEHGSLCGACGRALADGEAVYRITVFNGSTPFTGGYSRSVRLRCKDCAEAYDHRPVDSLSRDEQWLLATATVRKQVPRALLHRALGPPAPCLVCARPVVNERNWRRGRTFCSKRCGDAYWTDWRREQRADAMAEARQKRCLVCDEVFDATRQDAVTCSPACRQRAYRLRRALTERDAE
jgi:hypothetical protein